MTINEYQKELCGQHPHGMSKGISLILNGVLGLGGESGILNISVKHLFRGSQAGYGDIWPRAERGVVSGGKRTRHRHGSRSISGNESTAEAVPGWI